MISSALSVLENENQRSELEKIYTENKELFYSTAFKILQNHPDSEDAMQEAFVAIAKRPDLFFKTQISNRTAYIITIIRNKSYEIYNKRKKILFDEYSQNLISESAVPVDRVIESRHTYNEILAFIDTLPEAMKSAVYLKIRFELSNSEIADLLSISEDAVKARISRAINKIKAYMENKVDE